MEEDERALASDDLWLVGYALALGVGVARVERDAGSWATFHLCDGDGRASRASEEFYRGAALVCARELARAYRKARRLSWAA